MGKLKRLNFNQPAPDLTLKDYTGKDVKLSSLWAKKPLLLAFTRHFGCTQCKEMLSELVEAQEKVRAAGLDIAVIMQGTVEATAAFARDFAPGLYCMSDPERKAYKAYGLDRGSLRQTFLIVRVLKAVMRARKKGMAVEPAPEGQDTMQMSGTFIINRKGQVVLPYYYDDIADHPALELLVSGVLSTRWDSEFEGPVGIFKK